MNDKETKYSPESAIDLAIADHKAYSKGLRDFEFIAALLQAKAIVNHHAELVEALRKSINFANHPLVNADECRAFSPHFDECRELLAEIKREKNS